MVVHLKFLDLVVFMQPHPVRRYGGLVFFSFFLFNDFFFRVNPLLIEALTQFTVILDSFA